jgi:hypothetical protein
MNKNIVIGVFLICLLAFVAVFAFSQSNTSVRWEFMRVTDFWQLNELGEQGWELVSVTDSNARMNFFLKRRLP